VARQARRRSVDHVSSLPAVHEVISLRFSFCMRAGDQADHPTFLQRRFAEGQQGCAIVESPVFARGLEEGNSFAFDVRACASPPHPLSPR
jgi:hypothetical protein